MDLSLLMTIADGLGSNSYEQKLKHMKCSAPSALKYNKKKNLRFLKLEVIMVESLKMNLL